MLSCADLWRRAVLVLAWWVAHMAQPVRAQGTAPCGAGNPEPCAGYDPACTAAGAIACSGCVGQTTASCTFAADSLARLCAASGARPACSVAAGTVEAPQAPTPLLDISGLHTHDNYFPVIEITLTTSQRSALDASGGAQMPHGRWGRRLQAQDFIAPVSIHETTDVGDGPDVAATTMLAEVGQHGKSTLHCSRKSMKINLPEKVRIAGKKIKKMILISMCQDDSYVQMLSTMHIAQKLNMWKSFFHWVEVRWKVNGHVESRGIYIMNQRIEDKLEDEPGNTVVLRKNYGLSLELKRPDSESTVRDEMAVFRNLFSCVQSSSASEMLSQHLNLKQYMRWIALNDILQDGDYVDEVYFYNHYPDGTDEDTPGITSPPTYWDIHPWDYDDMFQRCHSSDCNEGVMDCAGNAFPLFFCAQSPIDRCLHSNSDLYEQYKATIRELLQVVNPPAYRLLALNVTTPRSSAISHTKKRHASYSSSEENLFTCSQYWRTEQVAEHIQQYYHVFPAVSTSMVHTDGHDDVWRVVNENIDAQQRRHQDIVSPAAELTSPSLRTVLGAELWTSAASPYILRGAIAAAFDVLEGALLSIEPGVRVLVSQGGRIHVSGGLLAAGQPDASIELGSLLDFADCQRWGGVVVMPSSHGVLLRHVWLVGATTALTVTGADNSGPVVIENCAFDDWQVAAVFYEGTDSLVLRQSSFGLGHRSVQPAAAASPLAIVAGGGSRVGVGVVIERCVFNAFRGGNTEGTRQPDMDAVIVGQGQAVVRSNTFIRDAIACDDGSSGLRINEVVAGQTRLITDRRGDYEDYIEIFNPSEAAVDLAGYTLVADDRCDADDEQPKERLSLRGQIEARGYLLIWADNDAYQGWQHAPFKLNKAGETVKLYGPDGAVVDSITYPRLEDDQAYGHVNDGCGDVSLQVLSAPSPGRSNAAFLPSGESPRVHCLASAVVVHTDTADRLQRIQSAEMIVAGPPPPAVPCSDTRTGSPRPSDTGDGAAGADSVAVSTNPCTGDVNGDKRVTVADVLLVLGAYGSPSPCGAQGIDDAFGQEVQHADINADCRVNVEDLLLCLRAFGMACPGASPEG